MSEHTYNDREAVIAFWKAQQRHLESLPLEERAAEARKYLIRRGAELPKEFPVRIRRQWNAALAERRAALAELDAEFSVMMEREAAAWEERYGEPYPMTLKEWQELAALVGIDPNYVLHGSWTASQLDPIIRGVLRNWKREADQRASEREAADPLELVERKTIVERFDVSADTVDRWRQCPWFPEPRDREAKPIRYKWAEVKAAVLKHKGRAPKIT